MNRIRLSKYVAFTFLFAVLFKICFLNAPTGQSQEEEINLTVINVTEKSSASSSIAKPSLKYQNCPATKKGFINVHLVPHSHDDVGWLNTFDEYYSGTTTNPFHNVSVAKILDSVVTQLQLNPSRRFSYAEMAFFKKWWNQQTQDKKNVVKNLVEKGQLEFINGGWCMNDEASTHYVDIIDQMALGLDFLNETFGECGRPKVAWQIDPFGHSREHASLVAQMGFDGMFLSRIDYQDKSQRLDERTMEMIWSGSNNLGVNGEIFTGVLYDHYIAPPGFCFDQVNNQFCHDPAFNGSDTDKRVSDLLAYLEKQALSFRSNNIIIPMGHDFTYQDATTWFSPMDQLIQNANKRQENGGKLNLLYSTPSCYLKSLNDDSSARPWPRKTDDFFPYASNSYEYWTGYYSSRPNLKRMIRQGSSHLQSCKQMDSALRMKAVDHQGDVRIMKEAMATMQHHDAVTGTERQLVANDYVRLLQKGVEECQKIENSFYRKEVPKTPKIDFDVKFCQLNSSRCELTENNDRFIVNIYNSIPKYVDKYVRIPVDSKKLMYDFQVLDPNGKVVESELVPIPDFVKRLSGKSNDSDATHELVFLASKLPPLGSKSFYIQPSPGGKMVTTRGMYESNRVDDLIISNEKISIYVDSYSGLMKSISIDGGEPVRLEQEFMWYEGTDGSDNTKPSGAYIFSPNSVDPIDQLRESIQTFVYQGELVQEVHQYHSEWIGQVTRLYKNQDHVELDWVVGPIPIENGVGKEIITRYKMDLITNETFYTDANGRQTLQRRKHLRESFKYTVTEPVAGDYYPINSHIYLKDESIDRQLTVLVDRAQGGTSLNNGQLELMLHRRLTHDDGFLNENLDDKLIVRGTHYLILSSIGNAAKLQRSLSRELYKQPQISFYKTDLEFVKWSNSHNGEVRLLNRDLPENVNLLTLESKGDGKILLRLEHSFDVEEDDVLSKPVILPLKGLLKGFTITSVEEAMLGGNEWKKDSQRLIWKEHSKRSDSNLVEAGWIVMLIPMQIRTFVLTVTVASDEYQQ